MVSSLCACGRAFEWLPDDDRGEARELACACGRRYDLILGDAGWTPGPFPLIPEARQPLAGFSRELTSREDSERFFFIHAMWPRRRQPVHVVFSPSAREAEVAFGDMKPLRLAPVGSAIEARRRWAAWFDSRMRPKRPLERRAPLTEQRRPLG